ncbi:MAG: hypothetical protein ACFFCE_09280 [Promethearchaeota archaeon]
MGFDQLSDIDRVNGIFALIFITISIIIGFRILLKYITLKRKELFTIGLAWIFLSSAWWGGAASFLWMIFTDERLSLIPFLIMSNMFIPIALICWIYSVVHIFYTESEKIITFLVIIVCAIYDLLILVFLFIDTDLVGHIEGDINAVPTLFPLIFQIGAILTALITGSLFSIKSIKIDDPEVKLKGKILLIGFISFSFAAFMDAIIADITVFLIITRIILISSSIEYYIGFFLPKILANKVNKVKN